MSATAKLRGRGVSYDPCPRSFGLPHLWPADPAEPGECAHCGKAKPTQHADRPTT